MISKRRFEKFYNRSMPLFAVEYWHQGERYGLPKITNNSIYYNPLFVYKKGEAIDVYYDIDNPEEADDKPIFLYFKNSPEKFKKIANQYEKECRELLKLSKQAKPKDFRKIFNLHLSFWPKFSVIISLGEALEENKSSQIAQWAYQLRQRTDQVEYISGNNLIKLAKQLSPDLANFIDFLTFEEITKKALPNKKELRKRKNKYIYFEGKLYPGLTVRQLERLERIKILQKDNQTIPRHILEGVTAMKGKVVGRVKIILELKKLSKVKKGDILVTPMTTPDYLMAMGKASAFVTDEGGLTCHAAIVAREIGKPCIIGTKIATQVLRDGDLIEVNGEEGIVKVIKRKK